MIFLLGFLALPTLAAAVFWYLDASWRGAVAFVGSLLPLAIAGELFNHSLRDSLYSPSVSAISAPFLIVAAEIIVGWLYWHSRDPGSADQALAIVEGAAAAYDVTHDHIVEGVVTGAGAAVTWQRGGTEAKAESTPTPDAVAAATAQGKILGRARAIAAAQQLLRTNSATSVRVANGKDEICWSLDQAGFPVNLSATVDAAGRIEGQGGIAAGTGIFASRIVRPRHSPAEPGAARLLGQRGLCGHEADVCAPEPVHQRLHRLGPVIRSWWPVDDAYPELKSPHRGDPPLDMSFDEVAFRVAASTPVVADHDDSALSRNAEWASICCCVGRDSR